MLGGIPRWDEHCAYEFRSIHNVSGRFFSPEYPQHYLPNARCRYYFTAVGEYTRVKVIFSKIKLAAADDRYKLVMEWTLSSMICDHSDVIDFPLVCDVVVSCRSCSHNADTLTVHDGQNSAANVIVQYCSANLTDQQVCCTTASCTCIMYISIRTCMPAMCSYSVL